jgi:hypothetical protein
VRFENLTSFLNHKNLRPDALRCPVNVEHESRTNINFRTNREQRDKLGGAYHSDPDIILDVIFSIVSQYAPVVVQAIRSVRLSSLRRAYHDLNTVGGTGHQIDLPHPVCPHRPCKPPYIVLLAGELGRSVS